MSTQWEDLSTAVGRTHLTWFGDEEPPMDFIDVEEDEPEVIILADGEQPPEEEPEPDPEKEQLKQQLAQLQTQVQNNENLGTIIGQQIANAVGDRAPSETPVQQPGETDEEFAKRFDDELFKPGKALGLIQEAVFRTAGRPFNQLVGITTEQSKQLLKLDPNEGPVFNRFEKEIESMKRKLPMAEQNDPKVYQKLLTEVKQQHPELQQEQFEQAVQQKVQEALKEMGINAEQPKAKPTYTESGGVRAQGGGAPPKTKRIYATERDKIEAARLGLDVKTYLSNTYGGSR